MTHPFVTAARPFRWQTAEGLRHATGDPLPTPTDDDEEEMPITTLCGADVTPQPSDLGDPCNRWPIPTCWDCEAAWREHEGIPDPPSRDVEVAR